MTDELPADIEAMIDQPQYPVTATFPVLRPVLMRAVSTGWSAPRGDSTYSQPPLSASVAAASSRPS